MNNTTSHRTIPIASIIGSLVIASFLLIGMRSAPTVAPNCDCPAVRLDDAYCHAELVFVGVPLQMDTLYVRGDMKNSSSSTIDLVAVRFRVERVLKGPETSLVVDIASAVEQDDCGFLFVPGMHYLVFAAKENGMLTTGRCTPTRNMDTVTRGFKDSLDLVMSGHQWEGGVPLDIPCQ